jgi:hypothetical protein
MRRQAEAFFEGVILLRGDWSRTLMERGFHHPGDAENRLGYYVGQLGRL